MTALDDYFAQAAPCDYVRNDCCAFPGGWVWAQTGIDPVAEWRGRYQSESEALAFVEDCGGVPQIMDKGLKRAGMKRTRAPREGDVGCVAIDGVAVGAIMKSGLWWVLGPQGKFPVRSARLLRAWTF
ncbi:hypothetical protein [uncultured Roseibium sp.]|uniref:DUF6950 family protein n=1 Tax=uncultured Roseibium sp. TaxID=1936171 RepID=UPI002620E443|nr:hypothetical protein [uncultured Roseibium sp.]